MNFNTGLRLQLQSIHEVASFASDQHCKVAWFFFKVQWT